jgi:endothelin-converting enzyme/putative endopeptidase
MKPKLKLSAALAVLVLAMPIAACSNKKAAEPAPAETAVEAPKTTYGTWGVDLAQRDEATKAGDDFARYANGKWLDTFAIPSDLPGYGAFTTLSLEAEADIRAIVEELATKKSVPGSLEQQVGDVYGAWMDEAAANAAGAAPLKPHLDAIAAIATKADLMKAFGDVRFAAPVGMGIIPDPADTTKYIVYVGQAGLGMPDRDYYLKADGKFSAYRTAYKAYIAKLFELAGVADGAAKADAILAFETKIAEAHWPAEESRDIQKIYNPMGPDKLAALAPEMDWTTILNNLGFGAVKTFMVAETTAIDKEAEIFAAADLGFVKDWMAFHFINSNAQNLSSDFDTAKFDFFSKTLRGVPQQRDRWKRGVNLINGSLGDAVGQIYVERHFPSASKAAMDGLVAELVAAFKERLEKNEWMDEATRKAALVKLSTFEPRIGYTTKWTDYSSLKVSGASAFENGLSIARFEWDDNLRKLAGPVDRAEWGYPPQTVNASYNPLLNQITFPAGILQPPFFDPYADAAVNFGAIGGVIGHEIGHGFDDQGRQFDEKGLIRDWWSKASGDAFKAKAEKLGAQYDSYEPLPGEHISGELTMGENIGDLGGLQMAYAAYRRHVATLPGGEAPVIDGLTGDQRFFLAWAQVWRAKYRDDAVRERLETDPHSPPYYRINGVVRNLDAWYDAFGVKEGDALYLPPEERIRIW